MTTRRWALGGVASWTGIMWFAAATLGLGMGESWAWAVAAMLAGLTTVVAGVAWLAVVLLVER